MSSFTYLITNEDIEWLDNYDEKKTNSIIKDVQRSFIKPLFPSYYEYLLSGAENNDLTKQDDYVLDEYIRPMMSLLCENQFYIKSDVKITTTGTNIEIGEEFDRASNSRIQALVNNNKVKIEVLEKGLIIFLTENRGVFNAFTKDYDCYYNTGQDYINMTSVTGSFSNSTIYNRRGFWNANETKS
jgi:hypothetical protein